MKKETSSVGIGFTGLLTLIFIVLKLLGKINWSWWWVIAPLWIPFILVFSIIMLFLLLAMLLKNK